MLLRRRRRRRPGEPRTVPLATQPEPPPSEPLDIREAPSGGEDVRGWSRRQAACSGAVQRAAVLMSGEKPSPFRLRIMPASQPAETGRGRRGAPPLLSCSKKQNKKAPRGPVTVSRGSAASVPSLSGSSVVVVVVSAPLARG